MADADKTERKHDQEEDNAAHSSSTNLKMTSENIFWIPIFASQCEKQAVERADAEEIKQFDELLLNEILIENGVPPDYYGSELFKVAMIVEMARRCTKVEFFRPVKNEGPPKVAGFSPLLQLSLASGHFEGLPADALFSYLYMNGVDVSPGDDKTTLVLKSRMLFTNGITCLPYLEEEQKRKEFVLQEIGQLHKVVKAIEEREEGHRELDVKRKELEALEKESNDADQYNRSLMGEVLEKKRHLNEREKELSEREEAVKKLKAEAHEKIV
ncbi:uncharacterized protein LOC132200372 isoform X2 [Neocloeon triangulifer]|uniref:uncharacterized protein LOC132200372 isoform X2 n=1 Tax=Neocloeon triangulifer TaxID=2078957 RepID=UPI00286F637B|nr:uncharacterized protein LOC132200372 isoform X2 [Neocloeon triangulifer]